MYPWERYTLPSVIDTIITDNSDFLYHHFREAARAWSENENFKNQSIGEARAIQELAFRDAVVSEKSKKIGKSEKYFWITVNPAKGTELPHFEKLIKKMYSKKWISSYAYVFENTSNDHMHSHGLIKATYEAARARKELSNSVSSVCMINNTSCFKFVQVTEEVAKEKLSYMLGQKKPKKLNDVEFTKQWRLDKNLQPIYHSPSPLILLDSVQDNVASVDIDGELLL